MLALLLFRIFPLLVLFWSFIFFFTPSVADAIVHYLTIPKPKSITILFAVYGIVLGPSAFLYGYLDKPKWLMHSVAVFLALATAITLLVGLLN